MPPKTDPTGRVVGILLAAGSGERLGAHVPKALVEVAGKPLVAWAAEALRAGGVTDVIVVIAPGQDAEPWQRALQPGLVHTLSWTGGATRAESVRRTVLSLGGAMTCVEPDFDMAAVDAVLVHDAARAFVPPAVVARVIAAVRGGAVAVAPAIPVVDTLREVWGLLIEGDMRPIGQSQAFDRARVRAVQTPQGFTYPVLLAAHAEPHPDATDDLVVAEQAGYRVTLVPGDERAFKVTRPADLARAAAVLSEVPTRDDGEGEG
ncbi:MAG: 2-C-methyl-D-erythritol 4-phosphate cytidylyltransferase [Actinomycetia bacterium]|nr:2-C-methyl-D-erythritol 4-phosphate cytidylyltransferase [Actinomycetes bacterium]